MAFLDLKLGAGVCVSFESTIGANSIHCTLLLPFINRSRYPKLLPGNNNNAARSSNSGGGSTRRSRSFTARLRFCRRKIAFAVVDRSEGGFFRGSIETQRAMKEWILLSWENGAFHNIE